MEADYCTAAAGHRERHRRTGSVAARRIAAEEGIGRSLAEGGYCTAGAAAGVRRTVAGPDTVVDHRIAVAEGNRCPMNSNLCRT